MEAKKSRWEIVGEFALENLPWLFIVIGIATFLLGFIDFGDGKFLTVLPSIFKSIGSTILGSGIFAAVLKSFQFTGVFKKAVAQVIYSSEYLRKQDRKYLENTWRQVSHALFTNKFPKFNDDMELAMLKSYFPADHNYYYQDFRVSYNYLKLEIRGDDPWITFEQHLSANIIPLEKNGEFTWITKYEGMNAVRQIVELSITKDNDKPFNLKPEIERKLKNGDNTYEVSLPCKCEKNYKLVKKEKRETPLNGPLNDQLEFCLTKVTSGLTVTIPSYDNKLKVSFVSKTIEDFKPTPAEIEGNIAREYSGIVLPTQGFCVVLSKI